MIKLKKSVLQNKNKHIKTLRVCGKSGTTIREKRTKSYVKRFKEDKR